MPYSKRNQKGQFIKKICEHGINPEEVKECFAPENLQWLPAPQNGAKGAMYNGINYRRKSRGHQEGNNAS